MESLLNCLSLQCTTILQRAYAKRGNYENVRRALFGPRDASFVSAQRIDMETGQSSVVQEVGDLVVYQEFLNPTSIGRKWRFARIGIIDENRQTYSRRIVDGPYARVWASPTTGIWRSFGGL